MNPVAAFSAILAALPSPSAIAGAAMTSAAGSIIVSGLQSSAGQNALDPLHLIFKPAQPNGAPTPTISAAAFAALPPTSQAELLQAGVHIV